MGNNQYEYIQLFEYVIERGHSRREISEKIGIATSTLNKILKGEKIPPNNLIRKLCFEFNIPSKMIVDYFYDVQISDLDEFIIDRKDLLENLQVSNLIKKIKSTGITYTEIGETVGLSIALVSKYSIDDSAATCELFRDLCLKFNVRPKLKKESYKLDIHEDKNTRFRNERSRLFADLQARYNYPEDYEAKAKEYRKIK